MLKKTINYIKTKVPAPLHIIGMEKSLFFIWIMLVLFGSSLGILFTYLLTQNWTQNTLDVLQQGSIYLISVSFSTALIADLFSSLILDIKERAKQVEAKEILFFENKIITIVILIFLIAIMATGYASLLKDDTPVFTIYCLQIISYLMTILLGIYTFGLKYSSLHEEDIEELIAKRVTSLKNAPKKDQDSRGRLI